MSTQASLTFGRGTAVAWEGDRLHAVWLFGPRSTLNPDPPKPQSETQALDGGGEVVGATRKLGLKKSLGGGVGFRDLCL